MLLILLACSLLSPSTAPDVGVEPAAPTPVPVEPVSVADPLLTPGAERPSFPEAVAPIGPGGASATLVSWSVTPTGCDVGLLTLPTLTSTTLARLDACPYAMHVATSGQTVLLTPIDPSSPATLIAGPAASVTTLPAPPAPTGLRYPDSYNLAYLLDGDTVGFTEDWATTLDEGGDCEGPCYGDGVHRALVLEGGGWVLREGAVDHGTRLSPDMDGLVSEYQASDSGLGAVLSTTTGESPGAGWNVTAGEPRVAWASWGSGESESQGAPVAIGAGARWLTVPGLSAQATVALDLTGNYLVIREESGSMVVDLRAPSIIWRGTATLLAWPAGVPVVLRPGDARAPGLRADANSKLGTTAEARADADLDVEGAK